MLNSLIEYYQSIYQALEERQKSGVARHKNCLTKIECLRKSILIKIVTFLKPFKEWTDSVEGDKEVTIYQVWPTYAKLKQHLEVFSGNRYLFCMTN